MFIKQLLWFALVGLILWAYLGKVPEKSQYITVDGKQYEITTQQMSDLQEGIVSVVDVILDYPPEVDTVGYDDLHELDMDRLYTPVLDDTRTLRECLQENKAKLIEAYNRKE